MAKQPCQASDVKMNKSLRVAGAAPNGAAAGAPGRAPTDAGRVRGGNGSSPRHRLGRPAPGMVRDLAGIATPDSLVWPACAGFGRVLQFRQVPWFPGQTRTKTIKHAKTQKNTDHFSGPQPPATALPKPFTNRCTTPPRLLIYGRRNRPIRPLRPNRPPVFTQSFPPPRSIRKKRPRRSQPTCRRSL
jgi:hypothetical protein